ncbi:hypothetical protein [Massilia consociata]|uniref:Uncharacterized protein n=1 Tax=Massilia consociata TaxID=760117 RepID=A0ABV6FKE5_9BURK
MRPWERRLRDLARLLQNCGETYFSPDLFRQNTNQFLQTSRTVTFIIQKNKADIPEYETWYKDHVVTAWGNDEIMKWAKDARNTIEKEGDLDMYSRLDVAVIYSHLAHEDIEIETPRPFLLQADINAIAKLAKSSLPPGTLDATVLKIERRWVANCLPEHELISALTFIYNSQYRVCEKLASNLNDKLDASIPHPSLLDPMSNDVSRARYIKIGKPNIGKFQTVRVKSDANFQPSPSLYALKDEIASMPTTTSLDALVEKAAKMAYFTFSHDGYHVPMLFLFDDSWNQIDFVTTEFADQADKFIFARNIARRAAYMKAAAFVFVSESWVRSIDYSGNKPIRDLPIIGEQLQLIAGDFTGKLKAVDWDIVRSDQSEKPALSLSSTQKDDDDVCRIFFVAPLIEAMKSVRPKS